jgi:hypothetical protein
MAPALTVVLLFVIPQKYVVALAHPSSPPRHRQHHRILNRLRIIPPPQPALHKPKPTIKPSRRLIPYPHLQPHQLRSTPSRPPDHSRHQHLPYPTTPQRRIHRYTLQLSFFQHHRRHRKPHNPPLRDRHQQHPPRLLQHRTIPRLIPMRSLARPPLHAQYAVNILSYSPPHYQPGVQTLSPLTATRDFP